MLFCYDIKICRDLRIIWKYLAEKVLFGSKTVFLMHEVHYYMVYIAYYTELSLQICNDAKNNAFVAKIVSTHLTKI